MRRASLKSRRWLLIGCGLSLGLAAALFAELGCSSFVANVRSPDAFVRPGDIRGGEDCAPASALIVSTAAPFPALGEAERNLARLGTFETATACRAAPSPPKHVKSPQVWKRDRQRPTVARLYVGDGNSLELVSMQVTVTVEGPRARTLVDQVFRNPHDRQLEGTFEYPLPTGASPSYFAMFLGQTRATPPPHFATAPGVAPLPADTLTPLSPAETVRHVVRDDWGKLQEARVVARDKALETYEDTVRGKIDPALLEYAGGNTFRGRVFPIPAKGYNRILIAYEELLPCAGTVVRYRYPLPRCNLTELTFTLHASAVECTEATFLPTFAVQETKGKKLRLQRTWGGSAPGGEVMFSFRPVDPRVQAISGRQGENGPQYVYARLRPDLKVVKAESFSHQAVFLLDTSLSEHPDRFAVNMKLLRRILETDPDIQRFNILTFDVAARWLEPAGWLENTTAGRAKAFARLDGVLLEGATDLSAALAELARMSFNGAANAFRSLACPVNVFLLSDGQITWGEPDAGRLAARFEKACPFPTHFHCYRTGLGADNLELFEALTRRGGGIFNCFGAGDLAAAARAHRRQGLQIERIRFAGGPEVSDVLVAGRRAAVYPGGELVITGRAAQSGRTQIIVEGTFLGRKFVQEYPVEIDGTSELAARGWAEVAVASLLALNDPKLDTLATAYCQQFGIAGRTASFLVLENEGDYKRLNLEEERGKTVAGDLGDFLEKPWQEMVRAFSERAAFQRFLDRVEPRVKLLDGADGAHVKKLLRLLADADFALPETAASGALLSRREVPARYLSDRTADAWNIATYVAEARRRAQAHDEAGAVRALSCVVEQYPGRSDALRLVGYRLLALGQPAPAVRLFRQVQQQRPFEPHSYRDLARSLEEAGKYGLAAVQYEALLAGTWHNRFGEALKMVVREEYVQMMRTALRRKGVDPRVANHFGDRLEKLAAAQTPSDLRVTISWNTDATDVDLWVIEPDATKVFYQNKTSPAGGELSQDQTQGYGPERYQIKKARQGVYKVLVHYFAVNPNLLASETHVQVVITRHAGTPREVSERHNVILKKHNEQIEVARVKF